MVTSFEHVINVTLYDIDIGNGTMGGTSEG